MRIALTCGKPGFGEPEDYRVVHRGYTGESAEVTYKQALLKLPDQFPQEEWVNAYRNLLVMEPKAAAAQYPCAVAFTDPSRL